MGGLGGLGPTNIGNGMFERKKENEITVAKSGGDFTTIEAALAVASARDVITVYPGIYQENNPLVAIANVTIRAVGEQNTTRIEALNANQDLFTSENFFIVDGFSLANVSGTGWVIDIAAAHAVIFEDCVVFQCEQGFCTSHASAVLTLRDVFYLAVGGTKIDPCMCNLAGSVTQNGGRVGVGSTVGTIFDLDGATSVTNVLDFLSSESTVDFAVEGKNGATATVIGGLFALMNDGLVMSGGSRFVVFSSVFANSVVDNVRIENVGADTQVSGQGFILSGAGRFNLNLLSATCTASGFGFLAPDQVNFVSGARITGAVTSDKEDDEGVDIYGELHVGTPELGTESTLGGGDSYTRGMLVYTFDPGGPTYTDVSAAARSASGSTFTFTGVALNHAIYVASSLQNGGDFLRHPGIKLSQTVAAVLGGGTILLEYWNGGAWTAIDHMSTLADAPYTQYAKALFERTGNEQVRYPRAFLSSWTKNDPMTLGTDYYWIRFRISSAITTAPIFEQWKLHTDRTEINADGVTEFFGAARPDLPLITHINLATAVVGSAPGNASVAFTATTTLTLTRNQFNDNQVHSFGQLITIPTGLDTSIPVTVEDVWYPDTVNAGDVELRAIPGQLEVGDLFDGSVADGATLADINTVAGGSRWQSRKTSFDIDVSDLVPGEFLVVRIERDATGGNDPPDTLSGNIVHAEFSAFGSAWRA